MVSILGNVKYSDGTISVLKDFNLLSSNPMGPIIAGASLERVPRVPRHPMRIGKGCLAPVLIIDLGIEHPKIRLRRPDFEVKEKILLPNRLEK